eukprot:Skav208635  [mRNA]  locus=scaffold3433:231994:235117:- [translate_table: standard]
MVVKLFQECKAGASPRCRGEDVWNSTSLLMVAADFFTCSIALFAVLQYERAFNRVLHPVNPFWKFWGVKGLLSVNFLQSTVLAIVSWITANDGTGFVATVLMLGHVDHRLMVRLSPGEDKVSDVNDEAEGTQMTVKDPAPEAGKWLWKATDLDISSGTAWTLCPAHNDQLKNEEVENTTEKLSVDDAW